MWKRWAGGGGGIRNRAISDYIQRNVRYLCVKYEGCPAAKFCDTFILLLSSVPVDKPLPHERRAADGGSRLWLRILHIPHEVPIRFARNLLDR